MDLVADAEELRFDLICILGSISKDGRTPGRREKTKPQQGRPQGRI